MPAVTCSACGEDEDLSGAPVAGDDGSTRRVLTCGRCGHRWDRDTTPTCGVCGSQDVEGIPTSTLREAGRGEQWAPSGIRLAYYCWSCRSGDVTSGEPIVGPLPPPGGSRDLRALRGRGDRG